MLRGETMKAQGFLNREQPISFLKTQTRGDWGSAWNDQSLGEIELMHGRVVQACAQFKESLVMLDRLGDKMGVSWCLCGLAGASCPDEYSERSAQAVGRRRVIA